MEYVNKEGNKLLNKMSNQERTDECNPQTLWRQYKSDVLKYAIKRERASVPKIEQEIRKTKEKEEELRTYLSTADTNVGNDGNISEETLDSRIKLAELTRYLQELEHRKLMQRKENMKTKYALESETMSKAWFRLSKEVKPRELIYSLRKQNPAQDEDPYKKNSKQMAELAREYHDKIQQEEPRISEQARERRIEESVSKIKRKLDNPLNKV